MNDEALQQIGLEGGEYHLYGPPGTGKTTTTSRLIEIAQQRFGLNDVMVTSFSKAAAKELISRNLPIHPDNVGTLHSFCFRALGHPRIIETVPALIEEWNQQHPDLEIPGSHATKQKSPTREEDEGEREDFLIDTQGDDWLARVNQLRGRMTPLALWTSDQRQVYEMWTEFKKRHDALDFTDLIEFAWRNFKIAPGAPRALFVDECQDLYPMQLALVRQWGRASDYYVLAFDDDQAIYVFTGVDPSSLITEAIPESHKLILDQSYRLPRAVHAYANRWIRQLGARRQEKDYRPRAAEGQIEMLCDQWGRSSAVVLDAIARELTGGRKVMLLATCAYMLRGFTHLLRESAIPFHNPYRLSHNGWNPLGLERPTGPAARVRALVGAASEDRHWKTHEVALWLDPMPVKGNLKPGAKSRIAELHPEHDVTLMELDGFFTEASMEAMLIAYERGVAPLGGWWHERLSTRDHQRFEMAVRVAEKRGIAGLKETPRVIVGTIHSVKGGEADTVILLPDVSPSVPSPQDIVAGDYPDDIIRTFYVGMTRAKEKLLLAGASSRIAVRWPEIQRQTRKERKRSKRCRLRPKPTIKRSSWNPSRSSSGSRSGCCVFSNANWHRLSQNLLDCLIEVEVSEKPKEKE